MNTQENNPTSIPAVLDSITLNAKGKHSIEYAKARCAIESALKCRKDKRAAKMAVVEFLKGEVVHPELQPHQRTPLPNYVLFADNSKARF